MWKYRGQNRPQFAEEPGAGQESVWDYPRPPSIEACDRLVLVQSGVKVVARSTETYRVLETASPPGFYIPPKDIDWNELAPTSGASVCEWKGVARYWTLSTDSDGTPVAWGYPKPTPQFERIRGYLSFYPGRIECYVGGERVRAQGGPFYGGWITSEIVGPSKGAPGTEHW